MKLMRSLRRFGRARSGIAALEFAILLPMMVFLLFGAVDLIDMVGVNRKTQNVAASLADVISRDNSVSQAEIDSLWSALNVLMYPDTSSSMKVRVSSVSIVNSSTARVVWSKSHGGMSARTAGSTITLPSGMMQAGSSVVVSETIYDYQSPLGWLNAGTVQLQHNAYRRSRLVDPIPCTWSGCS